ncbi:MAG: alpha/beta hydrolase [Candidatus Dormibacteraeota bacterium]|nr:alpha/beta hydrolase [Candidatus Dormibacteraeota bacterium]
MTELDGLIRVETPQLSLAVRDHPGGAPPLLALHGLASNARWWDLVAARLAPRFRVVAPDMRGHGLSGRPDSGYDFEAVVGDLLEVIAALKLPQLVVVGHSWGATVALALAAASPGAVLGAVCVDGGATDLRAYFGADWAVAERAMRPPPLRGVTPEAVRGWVEASPLPEGSDAATATEILLGNFEPDGDGLTPRLTLERHMQIAKSLYDLDVDALLGAVSCPVLFVPAGQEAATDTRRGAALERAHAVLGERMSVRWVDGGHDLPVQRPAEVAAAISWFVEERITPGG